MKRESPPFQLPCSPHLMKGFKGRNIVAEGGLRSRMAEAAACEHIFTVAMILGCGGGEEWMLTSSLSHSGSTRLWCHPQL